MKDSLVRTDMELTKLYQRNVDTIYRLCYVYLRNAADAEDAVQSVFLKLIKSNKVFTDYAHEKAWLSVVARNHCKDVLKSWWKSHRIDLEELPEPPYWDYEEESKEVLKKLLSLPEKYKTVLYLYYYENYSVRELSSMLGRKESTIQTQLSNARKRLKIDLEGLFQD